MLSMLVATTMLLVMEDVDTIGTRRQMFRARMLAEMGLAYASHPDVKPDDPLLHQTIGDGEQIDVEMIGEDGRFNPNVLIQRQDREALRRICRAWGMNLMQADSLIDAMIDWVDQDIFVLPRGAEWKQYGIPGLPFNRPFRSIDEMSLVRGMTEVDQVFPQWRDWFSIHASGALDLNSASPEIISAFTGADILIAQQMEKRRLGLDGIRNTQDDALLPDVQTGLRLLGVQGNAEGLSSILSVQSTARRIVSHGTTGVFTKSIIAIVQGGATGGASAILELSE